MKKLLLACITSFVFSATVYAQINQEPYAEINKNSSAGESVTTESKSPARMAVIDPETGELTSKPLTSQAPQDLTLGQSPARSIGLSGVASKPKLMPDGSRKIDFNGQFMVPVKAEISLEGGVETGHHLEKQLEDMDQ